MSKKNETKETPDYKKMFLLAEHYSAASKLLVEQSRGDQAKGKNWGCHGPHLLVDSFAVELYLKCLYVQDNKQSPPGIHDWERLFEELKEGTQKSVLLEYNRLIDADHIVGNYLLMREINPDALKVRDFRRALKAARTTFQHHRYLYEQPTPKPGEEWFYADFLKVAIRNITITDIGIMDLLNKP